MYTITMKSRNDVENYYLVNMYVLMNINKNIYKANKINLSLSLAHWHVLFGLRFATMPMKCQ